MKLANLTAALLFCITMSAGAQTPQQLTGWVTAPEGWNKGKKVETFNTETLYERINGAADAFLACKFVEMTTFDLTQQKNPDVYINVSMYRHASPADAFCIYAGERTPDVEFLQLGAEGYITGSSLHFVAASMYIKIRSHSSDPEVIKTMKEVAAALAKKIDPEAKLPKMLAALPQNDKVARSDNYQSENFLGYEFLHSAYQATYQKGGKEYTAYIIDAGSADEALKMTDSYLKQNKINKKAGEGRFSIKDPYNGLMEWLVKGNFIFGISMENKPAINPDQLLQQMAMKTKSLGR